MSTFRMNDILSFSFYRLIFKLVFTLFTVPLLSRGFSESKINDFSGGRFWLTIFTCLLCPHSLLSLSLKNALQLVYKPENWESKQKATLPRDKIQSGEITFFPAQNSWVSIPTFFALYCVRDSHIIPILRYRNHTGIILECYGENFGLSLGSCYLFVTLNKIQNIS